MPGIVFNDLFAKVKYVKLGFSENANKEKNNFSNRSTMHQTWGVIGT